MNMKQVGEGKENYSNKKGDQRSAMAKLTDYLYEQFCILYKIQ
jgi:hypothetical protein